MSSIRWIRNVLVDGELVTLEIMVGMDQIADKCYVRINQESEMYFRPDFETREAIVRKGVDVLQKHFADRHVCLPNGQPFLWV
jgi:hypothetical protein